MGKISKQQKALQNATRHAFLLTFFEKPDKFEVKELNGFYLVRQFNRATNRWEVAIFTQDSFNRKFFHHQITASQGSLLPADDAISGGTDTQTGHLSDTSCLTNTTD